MCDMCVVAPSPAYLAYSYGRDYNMVSVINEQVQDEMARSKGTKDMTTPGAQYS